MYYMGDHPAPAAADAAGLHEFMRQRAANAADDSSDDEEALAEAAAARQQRRAQEAGGRHAAARFVERAEGAAARGQLLEAVSRYTDAIELLPHDVDLLAARGQLCARLDRAHAALHDGELIVRLMPDWFQGHALCGLALFCMKQYAPAARAYRTALSYASGLAVEAGLCEALQDAKDKVGASLRQGGRSAAPTPDWQRRAPALPTHPSGTPARTSGQRPSTATWRRCRRS